jgi:small subunit ribosomal protein S10
MPKKNAHNVRIRLKSYDYKLLDQAAMHIAESAKRQGLEIRGPFPLPTKIKKWTVLRSPHVNKKSREQFERRTHHRLLDILNIPSSEIMQSVAKDIKLSAGVFIKLTAFQN